MDRKSRGQVALVVWKSFFLFGTLNREGAQAVNVAKWHKQSPNIGDSNYFYIVYDCLENHQTASGSHNRVVTLFRVVITEAFEVFSEIIFLRNPSDALYCTLISKVFSHS